MSSVTFSLSMVISLFLGTSGELGSPAGALEISEWVKGTPVKIGQGGTHQAYVIEFWATWCGPCRTSIPHLTELQKKYGSDKVAIIGVSAEAAEPVRKFVEKMGDKMDYAVAIDADRKTSAAYMGAYKVNGIPHAFIVNKGGNVVWHGHPMDDEFEKSLDAAIAGKLDPAADRIKSISEAYFAAVKDPSADASPKKIVDGVLKESAGNVAILSGLAAALAEQSDESPIMRRHSFQLAHAAVKATKAHDPIATETLAAIYFRDGNVPRAVRYQKLAIRDTAAGSDERATREAKLAEYEAAKVKKKPANEADIPSENDDEKVG